jgi:SAM-dependent methyltransferase
MSDVIGATHEFHDEEFAEGWAGRFLPTPERLRLFETIQSELERSIAPDGCVVELGLGPGYLAQYLLEKFPNMAYYGVDSSEPMLRLAQSRLSHHLARMGFLQADLVTDAWWQSISHPVDAVISTWALHDLGSQKSTQEVYWASRNALRPDGILLNGDFIKPDDARHAYEPGRFEIARHIELLKSVGFREAECLIILEHEIDNPTSAQNYACFKAVR